MAEQQSGISFDQLSISRYLCTCVEHVINSKTGLPGDFASQSNVFFKLLRSSVLVLRCPFLVFITVKKYSLTSNLVDDGEYLGNDL